MRENPRNKVGLWFTMKLHLFTKTIKLSQGQHTHTFGISVSQKGQMASSKTVVCLSKWQPKNKRRNCQTKCKY